MIHFTTTAFMVIATIPGRNGQYGSTTSIVGVFNKEKTAIIERSKFVKSYNTGKSRMYTINDSNVKITPITPNVTDEKILSEVYE